MESGLVQNLQSPDENIRANAVAGLASVPAESRESLFRIVAKDPLKANRLAAARLIAACPTAFQLFVKDPDPKVQAVAIQSSVEVRRAHPNPGSVLACITDPDFLKPIEGCVRVAIASVLSEHAKLEPHPNPAKTLTATILPAARTFMTDASDDVRTAMSESILELGKHFGVPIVLSVFKPQVKAMLADTQWRVKVNGIDLLHGLAIAVDVEFFNGHLSRIIFPFLEDANSRVRQFTLGGLPRLVEKFGQEWMQAKLFPLLADLAASPNCLHRELFLQGISLLAPYFPERRKSNYLYQPLIKHLTDKVDSVVIVALMLIMQHSQGLHPFCIECVLRAKVKSLITGGRSATIKELARQLLDLLPK